MQHRTGGRLLTTAVAAAILIPGTVLGATAANADDAGEAPAAEAPQVFAEAPDPSSWTWPDFKTPQTKVDVVTTGWGEPVTVAPLANDVNIEGLHLGRLSACTKDQGVFRYQYTEARGKQDLFRPATGGKCIDSDYTYGPTVDTYTNARGTWKLIIPDSDNPEEVRTVPYRFTDVGAAKPVRGGHAYPNFLSDKESWRDDIAVMGDAKPTSPIGTWKQDGNSVTFTPKPGATGRACAIAWVTGKLGSVPGGKKLSKVDQDWSAGKYPERITVIVDPKFTDVSTSHQFYDDIMWMGREGVTTGIAQQDGTAKYEPKWKVTREAMAAFLYRLNAPKGYQAPAKSPFADVKKGDPFYTEISWMADEGISTGIRKKGRTVYAPKSQVTREAMAAFMYRLDDAKKPAAPKTSPFADVKPGDKFYREISWMKSTGLSTGIKQSKGKAKYEPKWQTSREAMAAFLHRASGSAE